jgi:glycosyltransferase involved in cell wall biosynthesis
MFRRTDVKQLDVQPERKEMSSPSLVSVIMPVYNGGSYLRSAIKSVLAQTHPHVELIAVDDGSTDGSRMVLADFAAQHPDRVRVFAQIHAGAAAARNRAFAESRGHWLAFLDQDDLWEPHRLATQLAAVQPGDDLIHSECRIIDGTGRTVRPQFSTEPCELHATLGRAIRHNPIYVLTVLVRREAVQRVGYLDPANRFGTDEYHLRLKLLATGSRCRYLGETLASYRVHGGNTSRDHLTIMFGEVYAIEHVRRTYPRGFMAADADECRRKLWRLYLALGHGRHERGQWREALGYFRKAVVERPLAWQSWCYLAAGVLPLAGRPALGLVSRVTGCSRTVSMQNGWYG